MLGITFDRSWEMNQTHREGLTKEELSKKERDLENLMEETIYRLADNRYSKVTFYPYRTARVVDKVMFDADRDSCRLIESVLAIKAGAIPDNHTAYEVYNGCSTFYVWCHDGLFRVGKDIAKN